MTEHQYPIEIVTRREIRAVAFSANGKYIISGHYDGIRVWLAEDGQEVARLEAKYVQCLAVSQDGSWIAAGTGLGDVILWDANTYKQEHAWQDWKRILGVDFSPDATRLVTTSSSSYATVWDIATEKTIWRLCHKDEVLAAKYSPQADQIATATWKCVRIWDCEDGRLVNEIPSKVTSTGLVWFKNQIFIASGNKIQKIDASTVSEWQVSDSSPASRITLQNHGGFIACASTRTVTFWDTTTRSQLGLIQHHLKIESIALPSDDRFIAIAGKDGNITIKRLSHISAPIIHIDETMLDLWRRDQLTDVDALLSDSINTSTPQNAKHHALANRALVRSRLQQWVAAINDANESIKVEPSILSYIAKSFALVGNGEKRKAYRSCDIAFQHCHPSHVTFLLLAKAIIMFIAGEHDDAISRVDDLINMVHINSICYVVQAYMRLLIGNSCMEIRDFGGAIKSFEHAQSQTRPRTPSQALFVLSLMSGWKFDNLNTIIRRQLCEALYAAGRAKEGAEVVLEVVKGLGEEVFTSQGTVQWVSHFTRRCLNASSGDNGHSPETSHDNSSQILCSTLDSLTPSPLLREWTKAKLMCSSWRDVLTAAVGLTAPRFVIYRVICERLETIEHIFDASQCFLQMSNELGAETTLCGEQAEWVVAFRQRCAEKLERHGDVAADMQRLDDAITQYSAVLSLTLEAPHIFVKRSKLYLAKGLWKDALRDANQAVTVPSSPWDYQNVLIDWAKVNLMNGLWKGVLAAARDFKVPRVTLCRILCDGLESVDGTIDAVECFQRIASEWTMETLSQEEAKWVHNFKYRQCEKLEHFGDAAMDIQQNDEAIEYYSAALAIHPTNTPGASILESKVYLAKRLWDVALTHANEAIRLDPSSPWGYEAKRAALHEAGCYDDAIQAYETMLLKMTESADPQIRERRRGYANPFSTRTMIRRIVERTIRHSPRVLIDTTTGRLHNKAEQESAFMSLPIVSALVSSTTTRTDRGRIKNEVRQFFRYVMFSHKWEHNEPLFQQVLHIAVYDLDNSPTHMKLKKFCKMVEEAGFKWAWSDTCCINKEDHFVLQEALVAMFKWYRNAAMVFVFLRGVRSPGKLGELMKSLWNTRAWTLQEYVAAKVLRFFTEDWTPYRNLVISNHKESPEIISEMEQTTGVSARQLTALRPGLTSIREKLRLASTRQTTLVEDAAYSLLGIFSVTGIPPIYGEGEGALGRLLAHILAGSGDASILAWTGQSGGFNSCLPANISVFNREPISHLPSPIGDTAMQQIVGTLRASTLHLDMALKLYDRLNDLPAPWFAASRMKLPCISFKLPSLSPHRTRCGRVYRVETPMFGMVEIKMKQDPSRLGSLHLVHPWLDALLDRGETSAFVEDDDAEDSDLSPSDIDDEDHSDQDMEDDPLLPVEPKYASPPVRMETARLDKETRALRLVARLRQPFGALLLSLTSARRRAVVYKRVAAESEITVQLREEVALSTVLDNVRILDVL